MPTRPLLEIAVQSLDEALAAAAAGADRLELCADLDAHGLTPSPRLVEQVVRTVRVPVMAMLRPTVSLQTPRGTDRDALLASARDLLAAGAAGLVFGYVLPDGSPDLALTRELASLAPDADLIFHRAFDLAPDPADALASLHAAGVRRVLTAGMAAPETRALLEGRPAPFPATALEARLARLKHLATRALPGLEILPCGGVRAENAICFLLNARSGQVHAACRVQAAGSSRLDLAAVRALRAALDGSGRV